MTEFWNRWLPQRLLISTMNTPKNMHSNAWSRRYKIHIQGYLDEQWTDWFNGMTLTHHPDGYTCLVGEISDQAALHGILNTIRDIGFTLLSVNPISGDTEKGDDEDAK